MLLAGGVTYAEQRSFAYQRVDDQTRDAPFLLARALPTAATATTGPAPAGRGGGGDGPLGAARRHLRRAARPHRAARSVTLPVGSGITAKPDLPRDLPIGRLFTVDGDDGRYRVLAQRDPRTGGDPDRRRPAARGRPAARPAAARRGARDRRRAAAARRSPAGSSCAIGLLPLDRMGHTAGRIAGGDLSHRVEATDPRTEVGRLGIALNGMLDRLEDAFSRRQASEDRLRHVHRRRLARAAHAAGVDPRLRRAVPDGRRARRPRTRARDAADRGRGRAHGRARRGPADARAARRDRRRAARRASTWRRSPPTPSTTRARPRPTARSR